MATTHGRGSRHVRLRGGAFVTGLALIALGAVAAPAQAAKLDARVSPQHARVGERTCFEFSVSAREGRPLAETRINFLAKRARTGRDGEATICGTPEWRGIHTAWVSRGRSNQRKLEVRARAGSGEATGADWHRFAVHYDAYGEWGGCSGGPYGDAVMGACAGTLQGPGWDTTPPMDYTSYLHKGSSRLEWTSGRGMYIHLYGGKDGVSAVINGWVPGPESAVLNITSGFTNDWLPEWGSPQWPRKPNQDDLKSGTDTSKLGQPGGPVSIRVTANQGGYVVDMRGYLWY